MDPMTLIPSPGVHQVDWWIYQVLLSVGFFIHILLVNVMLGGAAVACSNTLCNESPSAPIGREISTKLPTVVAFTVNFGVAPLLFLQVLYGHIFYVSDILMGWYWLSVPFLIMISYYLAYIYDFKFDTLGSIKGLVAGLAALCMMVVAFFFVNNLTMFITPERWPLYFDQPDGTILNWGDPTLIPRYLHFILGSLGVGGLVTALMWRKKAKTGDVMASWYVDRGMKWFFRCTLAQFIVGPWLLLAMERRVMLQYMGHSGLATALFLAGLIGGFFCLHAGFFKQVKNATIYLLSTVAFMVGVREMMRIFYLEPYYSIQEVGMKGEYSPMIMFGIVLVVGLVAIAYILRLAARAGKEA